MWLGSQFSTNIYKEPAFKGAFPNHSIKRTLPPLFAFTLFFFTYFFKHHCYLTFISFIFVLPTLFYKSRDSMGSVYSLHSNLSTFRILFYTEKIQNKYLSSELKILLNKL